MLELQQRITSGASIVEVAPGRLRLSTPAGPARSYRLAQLDDYTHLRRRAFPWRPPLRLSLRARASGDNLPGTWGFGFWNDPFNARLGLGGTAHRAPALPNAAWFFWASPPNYLAVHDHHPTQGFLAATFRSPALPAPLLALSAPALPLLAWSLTARMLRHLARGFVREDATLLTPEIDPTAWHSYALEWLPEAVRFWVDERLVCETSVAPADPLGFVIWIDNQYAAFPPHGRLSFGRLANPSPAWLEVEAVDISIRSLPYPVL